MLSKRTALERLRLEEEVVFIPSTKIDMVKTVFIFLREVNSPDYPYQITVCLNDFNIGRLGYYDLNYKEKSAALNEFHLLSRTLHQIREESEYEQISCVEFEKRCRNAVDKIMENANMFDSSYHGRYKGRMS